MNDQIQRNMEIYEAVRTAPASAVKRITGGSYGAAGLSDINPQWRIERMTALFGPVGKGWTWEPVEVFEREGVLFGHVVVKYLDKESGQYSAPIHGYGGTQFGRKDDSDIYKSTMTDAVSNALRYLGVGADVWYSASKSSEQNQFDTKFSAPPVIETITVNQAEAIRELVNDREWAALETKYGSGLLMMQKQLYPAIIEKIRKRKESTINE